MEGALPVNPWWVVVSVAAGYLVNGMIVAGWMLRLVSGVRTGRVEPWFDGQREFIERSGRGLRVLIFTLVTVTWSYHLTRFTMAELQQRRARRRQR
jgi:hypothetical protein